MVCSMQLLTATVFLALCCSICFGFIVPFTRRTRALHSSNPVESIPTIEGEDPRRKGIIEEITQTLDFYIDKSKSQSIARIDPSVLFDKSHFLAKGNLFEEVKQTKLDQAKPSEINHVQKVCDFLQGFIDAERRTRAKLKVEYLIAGVALGENKIDEAVDLLHKTDEIDSHLFAYLDSLISSDSLRNGGVRIESSMDSTSTTVASETLRSIRKRLQVEDKMRERDDMKLLALLLRQNDTKVREEIMIESLQTIDKLNSFLNFVEQGIDYIQSFSNSGGQGSRNYKKYRIENPDQIKVIYYPAMKDILVSLRQWRLTLQSGDTLGDNVYTSRGDNLEMDATTNKLV